MTKRYLATAVSLAAAMIVMGCKQQAAFLKSSSNQNNDRNALPIFDRSPGRCPNDSGPSPAHPMKPAQFDEWYHRCSAAPLNY